MIDTIISSLIIFEEYTTQERTLTLNTAFSFSVKGRLVVVGSWGGGGGGKT